MRHPEHAHLLGGKFLRRHLPRAVKRSTRVIVPSEATARDCEALLGVDRGRLAVIPHGGAEEFATPPSDEAWERFEKHSPNLPARFWLTVATIEPRKNLGALLDAIEILRGRESEAANLLLAGGHGWGASRIENRLVALHEEELVHSVGHVDTEWLRCALRRAEGLVMPSLAEGFGLPLLEAMASGCPVLCSDIPVFHEVTGDNALFFDPHRPESIADALHSAFQNRPAQSARAERARAFIAPFTWARAAERTLEVYREALQ
jgi:alpha-1,3-rhamnosyl/mannosyltransferase